MSQLVGAMIAAAGSLIVASLVMITRTLLAMRRDIIKFSVILEAIAETNPFVFRANRYQNEALKEVGANGATIKANACIDEAEKRWSDIISRLTKGETK